jgi:sulfur carrier protein ThiS
MRIRVKLMGLLKDRAPDGGSVEVADGATIEAVLRALDIAPPTVRMFTVNGQLERDVGRSLAPNDELTIISPVVGG